MGRLFSTLGAFLAVLLVSVFFFFFPESFIIADSQFDVRFKIISWGGFLLMTAYLIGSLNEQNKKTSTLNQALKETNEELKSANEELKSYTEDLDKKALELEEKNEVITHLKERIEDALYSTMDKAVANLFIENRVLSANNTLSVLFSDLVGFSTFSGKMLPELVVDELNGYFGEMETVISKYKGHIDKYLGDGIMCEFGAPVTDYRLHSLHAVVASIYMQRRLEEIDLPLKMRIGISTGYAITGLIGHQKRSYTAIGDVVNLAKRLEELCPPGSIVVDEETLKRVERYVDFERIKIIDVDGGVEEEYSRMEKEIKINSYLHQLKDNPKDVKLLYEIGKLYFDIYEITNAIDYFRRALELEPNNIEIKIAYADATLNRDIYEKIEIKGKKERVAVFKILGLKDPFMDRNIITESFYNKYKDAMDIIKIPYDLILPIEVLDGSIGSSKVGAIISYGIADELDLPEAEKERIMNAAFLRDIGKEKIPAYLLNRDGKLTEAEFKEIMKHSLESLGTVKNLGYNDEKMLDYIRDHHEQPDGKGYPEGKKGDEISLGARIVSIADYYTALTSVRPYRGSWDKKMAVRELEREFMEDPRDSKIIEALSKLTM
ncbi:MAG: adenylate/guanylate cyclase domain-containing protein [Pseudomonadota bacterium]